jgi:type I restriction enzyme, S subunit
VAVVEWETVPLADVLERVSRPVALQTETEYTPLGVRWYGEGVFQKEKQLGSKIAAKTLYQVEPGDVVYSRLFPWKGSFGVVDAAHAAGVVSNEFPTYRPSPDLLPEFFVVWASQPRIWSLAEVMSSGTTANSRFRLSEESFLMLEIDLPPIDEQRRIVGAVSAVGALSRPLTMSGHEPRPRVPPLENTLSRASKRLNWAM